MEKNRYVVTNPDVRGPRQPSPGHSTSTILLQSFNSHQLIVLNVFQSHLVLPFVNSCNTTKNQIRFTKAKAWPVSAFNNPRGVLHWTLFMLLWKNCSVKLQHWPLLELKDFTFSYPRMAFFFPAKHQSDSKNNLSKNDTTQSLQNLEAYCGRKTLAAWSALWNWHYYESVMACLLRQREKEKKHC